MNVSTLTLCTKADFTKRRLDQPMIERLIPYLRPYHAVLGRSFITSSHPRLALQIQDVQAQGLATTSSCRSRHGCVQMTGNTGVAWAKPKATREQAANLHAIDDDAAMLRSEEMRDKHGPRPEHRIRETRGESDVCIGYAGVHFFPQR
jgi:hypothetical protein